MKTITLEEAITILLECSAVIIDNEVTYPNYYESEEFLHLSWEDADYHEFCVCFMRGDNEKVSVAGSSMFLIDENGEENQLTILVPQKLD